MCFPTFVMLVLFFPAFARAYDLRWGAGLGYGGAGVKQNVNVEGVRTDVQKSEGPGVATFFIENLVNDNLTLGAEHSFGFRYGPFSAGINFTGATSRWYVFGPAVFKVDESTTANTYFVKRYAPFYGFSGGIATAFVSRTNDLVGNISTSGVYLGFKGGVDYSYQQDMIFRYEAIYNTTFMSNVSPASSLNEFALQFAVYFFIK